MHSNLENILINSRTAFEMASSTPVCCRTPPTATVVAAPASRPTGGMGGIAWRSMTEKIFRLIVLAPKIIF